MGAININHNEGSITTDNDTVLTITENGGVKIGDGTYLNDSDIVDESYKGVIRYNKDTDSNIVAFNIKGVFAQDTAIYLDKYNICVRAGNHCAKILKDVFNIANTLFLFAEDNPV